MEDKIILERRSLEIWRELIAEDLEKPIFAQRAQAQINILDIILKEGDKYESATKKRD